MIKYKYFGVVFYLLLVNAICAQTVIVKGENYGLVNQWGKPVIPFKYESISKFPKTPYYLVQKGEKFGLITRNGKKKVSIKYHMIDTFPGTPYCLVRKNDLYGLINHRGKKMIPLSIKAYRICLVLPLFMLKEIGYMASSIIGGGRKYPFDMRVWSNSVIALTI